MNLSEIRKKAQQERQESQPQEAAPRRNEGVEPPVVSAGPVVSSVAVPEPPRLDPVLPRLEPVPVTAPIAAEPPPYHFDPVSLIMAGRHDSLELETSDAGETQSEAGEDEFEECLCFRVSSERYAISIMEIKEITKPRELTEVPRVPSFVPGVISLRGVIVPILDLKQRLNLTPVADAGKARIIVVKKGEEFFGILVDEVIQVVKVPTATIELPPAVLEGIDREFVRGIGRHDGRMLILLHLGKILDLSLN